MWEEVAVHQAGQGEASSKPELVHGCLGRVAHHTESNTDSQEC